MYEKRRINNLRYINFKEVTGYGFTVNIKNKTITSAKRPESEIYEKLRELWLLSSHLSQHKFPLIKVEFDHTSTFIIDPDWNLIYSEHVL
jgi:hypothetical protein